MLTFFSSQNIYTLTPNAQIWPRRSNTLIRGSNNFIYLVIHDMGPDGVAGIDFILGYVFLQRFVFVFDTDTSRVGFATTLFTTAMTN